ncbi:MAG TPA: GAF domain-containing protein [Sphaerochaeta sp.]|nr:GAF domain-containing protein [Sphaerochaeta sp.]
MSLLDQVAALIGDTTSGELARFGALANVTALLYEQFDDINWVGFYLTDESGELLRLGPFQGRVACTEIPFTRGVCGTAARTKESVRVADVSTFADHIVCDSASRSELVIPLITADGTVVGVLDLDSPRLGRFSSADQEALEAVVDLLVQRLWS